MNRNQMILAQNRYYSLNCMETQLNNNVLVVGASGAGKTRSIVTPNLLQAEGSYIVSDPKGNLYNKYRAFLEKEGYVVKKLDFTDPMHSAHYNFFHYIRNTQDIVKVAHMMVYQHKSGGYRVDPFWEESEQLLLQALIAYLRENWGEEDQNFGNVFRLAEAAQVEGHMDDNKSPLDILFEDAEKENEESYAVRTYKKFRVAANRTLRSILISLNTRLGTFDTPEIEELTKRDELDIASIGEKKTALFVVASDTDRSMDPLVNLFFTQAMSELCLHADKECAEYRLPVPVRFIMDDFATNCTILDFPKMIATIRSRNISTMLMIQAESQLEEQFGYDAKTIIGNCDTYVYLGGNDIETARAVAERCDMPLNKILNMPVGTNWIFRRGQAPVNGVNFNLNMYLQEKSLQSRSQTCGEKRNVFSLRIKDLISAADYFLEREVRKMANTWNPCIEVESAHGTREILLTTRHLMNRKIFLEGEINSEMANAFLSQLLYLEEEPGKPVTIYINSPGGEVNAGLMIYDALMGSNLTVNMVCAGTAASMAAIIFAGGQKGRRYILPHSKVMIHEPLIAGGVGGSATSIHNISESILETRKICNGILAEHTGKTIEEIDEATSYDHYMNADEAIKFGICDLKITSLHLPSIGVK